jgi:hypothetical protein
MYTVRFRKYHRTCSPLIGYMSNFSSRASATQTSLLTRGSNCYWEIADFSQRLLPLTIINELTCIKRLKYNTTVVGP